MKLAAHLYTLPLNELEKEHLTSVFQTRVSIFCTGFSFFVGFLLWVLAPYGDLDPAMLDHKVGKGTDYELFGLPVTHQGMFYLLLCFFGGLILTTGLVVFFRKVYPFRKDVRYGRKEAIIYTITAKRHFPLTNEYFFSFEDPDYMHYEVEGPVYHRYEVGDEVALYRTRFSKHVFEKDFRFTLL